MKLPYVLPLTLVCVTFTWGQTAPQRATEWQNGNRIVLSQMQGRSALTSTYSITPEHDLSIAEKGIDEGKKIVDGSLMLISGNWLAIKNLPVEKGYEIDELDGEVLTLKMLFALLDKAAPAGPGSVSAVKTIRVSGESEIPINTYTAGAACPDLGR